MGEVDGRLRCRLGVKGREGQGREQEDSGELSLDLEGGSGGASRSRGRRRWIQKEEWCAGLRG